MYAGRQVHPFFSLWKEAKKVPDVSESGSNLPTAKSKHKRATCGPIHVFENVKVCYFWLGAGVCLCVSPSVHIVGVWVLNSVASYY